MTAVDVDLGLARVSNDLLTAAVLLYVVAALGYAAEFAFSRRPARRAPGTPRIPVVHAAADLDALPGTAPAAPAVPAVEVPDTPAWLLRQRGELPPVAPGALPAADAPAGGRGERLGRVAVALTVLGWACHAGSVLTRGLAAHRVPWGNMYEFSCAITLAAVTAYLVVLVRQRVRFLGAFVLLPVVVTLGIAGTLLYSKAEPLQPALQSYWLKIHVTAAVVAWGTFMVGTVQTALYLAKSRYEARAVAAAAAGRPVTRGGVMRRLPSAEALDQAAYRTTAFAFPIWTFAIIAGAVWAEKAWGRYWGWDPKETWSFITWVIYAGYLHARATAGWRGRKAALVAIAGFSALTIDYYVVNIVVTGLHSYAGL